MSSSISRQARQDYPSERQIFSSARRLVGQSRSDYLLEACGADTDLRQRVVRLLDSLEEETDLLEREYKSVLLNLHGSSDTRPEDLPFSVEQVTELFEPGCDDSIGRVSHYEIKELIGRGAFGVVFRAFDTKLARMVAIKVLAPTLSRIGGYRERFLQEARAAAAIEHVNVVRIHSVEDSPFPFIAMELVNGETLRDHVLNRGPLPTEETFDLGIQIVKGLAAAHEKGIVHLDVKPANILLEPVADGKKCAKLTDFGLALIIDGPGEVFPASVLGTPAYMAPEHAKGESVDQRADLFSFGSVLYTMSSGQAAFSGSETRSVLRGIVENKRAELPEGVQISKTLLGVINRLHSTLPENRYDSADEVLADLVRNRKGVTGQIRSNLLQPTIAIVASLLCVALALWWGFQLYSLDGIDAAKGATKVNSVQACQQLEDVILEIKNRDEEFQSDKYICEIADGNVSFLRLPFARDLSPLSQLTEVKVLDLMQPDSSERRVDVGIEFVSQLKNLRILHLQQFPVKSLEPLRGMPLEKLNLWYCGMKVNSPYRARLDLDIVEGMPLWWLNCGGCIIDSIEPLQGMKLEELCMNFSKPVSDIAVLRGMPLATLQLNGTEVEDLSPLAGAPLKLLELSHSKVHDLSPIVGMDLDELFIEGLEIDDISVLKHCRIKSLTMDYEPAHGDLIKSVPGLERINGVALEEFFSE